jgi:enamine deaminase RidA (YjgF/YER057c/UK114 family)
MCIDTTLRLYQVTVKSSCRRNERTLLDRRPGRGRCQGNIVGIGDIAAQTEQVLRNLRTALAAAGAGPEHVVKWNVVVVDGQDFGSGYAAFQRAWGDRPNPPVITATVVKGLAHPDFLVEMDAIAVVPA